MAGQYGSGLGGGVSRRLFPRGDWNREGLFGRGGRVSFDSGENRGGKEGMFFETEPHSWGFHHVGMPRPLDPDGEEGARARPRPKFRSFDALRPGVFAPRPFQRERRSSDGSGCYTSEEDARSQASSTGSCGEPEPRAARERIIPIRLEEDEPAPPPPQRPARKHSRRDTADGPPMKLVEEEAPREERAQSCPAAAAGDAPAGAKPAPLDVDAAMAAQQREARQPPAYGKPNYFNSSPKPFSPGAKPFQAASFGNGMFRAARSPPAQAERTSAAQRQPPKVPPKPSAAELRAGRHEREPPPPVRTAKEEALQKIEAVRSAVDPLARRLDAFAGTRGDKEYLYLDEMLTRELLRLDDVETGGDGEVRNARKDAIRRVQDSLMTLERQCSPAPAAPEPSQGSGTANEESHAPQKSADPPGGATSGESAAPKLNGAVNGAHGSPPAERRPSQASSQVSGLARAEPAVASDCDGPADGDQPPPKNAASVAAARDVTASDAAAGSAQEGAAAAGAARTASGGAGRS